MRLADYAQLTPEALRTLAVETGACVRPLVTRVTDTMTGEQSFVPIPCGSTRESVCPPCATRARRLRMQQCREGWHLTEEPAGLNAGEETTEETADDEPETAPDGEGQEERRVRSTRRRQDVPELPRIPVEDRTVGRTFTAADGTTYRPSMFLTLTLPSYGRVRRDGTPRDPDTYDYRRAALDALHFPKLVDRFWQNLRRCAGYRVQYFATVEAQKRLAPHLHAGIRGVIPRVIVRQVVAATYHQVWWPPHERPTYTGERLPVWDDRLCGYVDPAGSLLPTWEEALDELGKDPNARPAHVVRFGEQLDMQGLLGGSPDADRRVGYLCKYLTKTIAGTHGDDPTRAQRRHVDRLHEEVRWLPCSPECANWLRFDVQPRDAEPGMVPGQCPKPAHERENLGLGGRRVLVSRQWTGKTLDQHRADRAEVVRQVLDAAGMTVPETDRCSATALRPDGQPRYVWEQLDPTTEQMPSQRAAVLHGIRERIRWRNQYQEAKRAGPTGARSATDRPAADAPAA